MIQEKERKKERKKCNLQQKLKFSDSWFGENFSWEDKAMEAQESKLSYSEVLFPFSSCAESYEINNEFSL